MHELSIAIQIVEMAEEETRKAGCQQVTQIELEVGTLSGVEMEALEFAMQSAVLGSLAEKARVRIHQVPAMALCNQCQRTFPVEDLFTLCPDCQSYDTQLVRGNELRLKSLIAE